MGETVLVIDDHVSLAHGFALALQSAGYVAYTAGTAEDGLRLAEGRRPAAIILDLKMPFVDGCGFLYRLRACPEHTETPVLVVTGAAVDDEMKAELEALGTVVRYKPIGLRALLDEVDALLQGRRPERLSELRQGAEHGC
jgi:DNA-binding response OmpR family regulator